MKQKATIIKRKTVFKRIRTQKIPKRTQQKQAISEILARPLEKVKNCATVNYEYWRANYKTNGHVGVSLVIPNRLKGACVICW